MTNTPSPNRYTLLVVLGVFVLAVVGVGFLVLAVVLLTRGSGPSAAQIASPTFSTGGAAATQIVFVPTTTQGPPTATLAPTAADTPTAPPASPTPSAAPATSTVPSRVINVAQPANVRSGPGQNYPVIGGINAGQTAPVIGRDSSAQWFAISFENGPQGTGWVSTLVASYAGSLNDLPIIQAAAAPPPQATAVPPTNPPAPTSPPQPVGPTSAPVVAGANGIVTLVFRMHKTTGAPNESIFFDYSVENETANTVTYGILAAHTDAGVTADSWHQPLLPGKPLPTLQDHINFPNTGSYQVYLGICYSSHDACKTGGATWTRLSPYVTVVIQ